MVFNSRSQTTETLEPAFFFFQLMATYAWICWYLHCFRVGCLERGMGPDPQLWISRLAIFHSTQAGANGRTRYVEKKLPQLA